jgi:hypothetical protein
MIVGVLVSAMSMMVMLLVNKRFSNWGLGFGWSGLSSWIFPCQGSWLIGIDMTIIIHAA